jgi:aminodeoxyfutalosine deaminase
MKHFSAQYIITNNGPLLKRGLITTDDDGTIISVADTGGVLEEKGSLEFHNGIIVPGFINCHSHLELSHMKGSVAKGGGLSSFIEQVRNTRENSVEKIVASAYSADIDMYKEGIVLCADICNTPVSFGIKKESRISYLNLIEVFGIDPQKAGKRMNEAAQVAEIAEDMDLPFSLVPHSLYSMSLSLLRLLRERSRNNLVTSVHFMETAAETSFLHDHSGPLMASFEHSGLLPSVLESAKSHSDAVLNEITPAGNLILVHNTFADQKTVRMVMRRNNLFWCLCPGSNIYIENEIPPVDMLREEGCEIVMGTDSLASNRKLSILEELKTIQSNFPSVATEELIRWATINGARALQNENIYGTIETGKKPGLLLIQNVDLIKMKLLPESFITRLI